MSLTFLAVGAHIDDNEDGIGGIIIKAVKAGHRVVTVVAAGDYSSWGNTIGREEQCKRDQLALARRFGYEKRFLNHRYHQVEANVAFKKEIAEIYAELQPDITFVHCTGDHWPDHVACGIATKDAVLFSHGLSSTMGIRRCPRIFAYNVTPEQTIRFEPDFFVDITAEMPAYMELIQGTDGILSNRPPEQTVIQELKDLRTGQTLRVSGHGWRRLTMCAGWGHFADGQYAIGLQTLWGPRDGRPLWG
jgi:LmbE family N-acetylglucosaminyl deacetylase